MTKTSPTENAIDDLVLEGFGQTESLGLIAIYVLARRLGKEKDLLGKTAASVANEYSDTSDAFHALNELFENVPDSNVSPWENLSKTLEDQTDEDILMGAIQIFGDPFEKIPVRFFSEPLVKIIKNWVIKTPNDTVLFALRHLNSLPFQICGNDILSTCQITRLAIRDKLLLAICPSQKIFVEEKSRFSLGKVSRRYSSAVIFPEKEDAPEKAAILNALNSIKGRIAILVQTTFLSSLNRYSSEKRKSLLETKRVFEIILLPRHVFEDDLALILVDEKEHESLTYYDLSEAIEKEPSEKELLEAYPNVSKKVCVTLNEIAKNNDILDAKRYFLSEKEKQALDNLEENAVPLEEIAQIIRVQSHLRSKSKDEEKVPCHEISAADIDPYGFISPRKIKQVMASTTHKNRYEVRYGDILIAIRGALGKFGFVNESPSDWIASQSFVIIRVKDANAWPPEYVFSCLQSDVLQKYLETIAKGVVMPIIYNDDLRKIPILKVTPEKAQEAYSRHQKKLEILQKIKALEKQFEEDLQKLQDEMKSLVV